jgi:TolA-binding protein
MKTRLLNTPARNSALRFGFASIASLALSTPAWALSCDEIMNMVNVNVPASVVVQTIDASGSKFSSSDVQCLESRKAPAEIIAAARKASTPAAAPAKKPASKTEAFDSADEIAPPADGDAGASDASSGADEDSGNSPKAIDELIKLYRAKKVLTASKGLYELMQDNTYPDQAAKISYYLAKSLYDLGMYHGAEHYFMQVVRKGPKNPYFKYALPKLVAIAELTGDDTELLRVVEKIPVDSFPRGAQSHLYYLLGRELYDEEKLAEAAKYFGQVASKDELGLKAKYYEGVINNQRGKLKSAVKSFTEVYKSDVAPADERQAGEIEDLKDLALMNIARIYYTTQNFDNADSFYALVDRDSTFWPESLYERAYTNFMRNDLNLTLGLLLTVRSPYFADGEFMPKSTILRSLTLFNLCKNTEVASTLKGFEADYRPIRDEMRDMVSKYDTDEGRKIADQLYDYYFGESTGETRLPKSVFVMIMKNRDFADLVRHLDLLDAETTMIDAQKDVWKSTIGEDLRKTMADDRVRYKRRAGLILLREFQRNIREINDLLTQSELIRFEVVDAQRLDYEYKMQNPEVESLESRKVDFATSRNIIYWPFNGEFWQDELGYYRYTEEPTCKNK